MHCHFTFLCWLGFRPKSGLKRSWKLWFQQKIKWPTTLKGTESTDANQGRLPMDLIMSWSNNELLKEEMPHTICGSTLMPAPGKCNNYYNNVWKYCLSIFTVYQRRTELLTLVYKDHICTKSSALSTLCLSRLASVFWILASKLFQQAGQSRKVPNNISSLD